MAVCALKGYELLGGKLTKKGIIISVVIMIIMTYVGDRLDWGIMIARELEVDVFYGYRLVPLLLSEEIIDATSYVGNLVLVYAFLLLGAIPTIRNAMRRDKVAGTNLQTALRNEKNGPACKNADGPLALPKPVNPAPCLVKHRESCYNGQVCKYRADRTVVFCF